MKVSCTKCFLTKHFRHNTFPIQNFSFPKSFSYQTFPLQCFLSLNVSFSFTKRFSYQTFLLNMFPVTKCFLSQNVSCHKMFPVTKCFLSQNVSCHKIWITQNVSTEWLFLNSVLSLLKTITYSFSSSHIYVFSITFGNIINSLLKFFHKQTYSWKHL